MWARQIPNLITGTRIMLVPLMVWLLLKGKFTPALGIFTLMGASDALDGYLAKRYGWQTNLGKFMDPLADKTMLISAYVALGWLGLIPIWLVILVVLRDIVILGGAAAYHVLTRHLSMVPSLLSKLNTLAQIVLVLAVIFDQLVGLPSLLIQSLVGFALITTVTSGVGYVIDWSSRARKALQKDME
ncbi:MAG: CDP-alcohol phosphatidyltransferase family protein [Gammaproteobacteria bacterium]|nr:CDP-alcohol phosphatidyltransferase family protein [Gammaproteobacteria bacterium]